MATPIRLLHPDVAPLAAAPADGRGRAESRGAAPGTRGGTPEVRTERKVGRNEPCPCGSGKKYKKCHGA